jgi:imidazolonepropionase-like amidohydrolase
MLDPRFHALAAVALACAGCGEGPVRAAAVDQAQDRSAIRADTLVLRGATALVGRDLRELRDAEIVIAHGRIVSVGQASNVSHRARTGQGQNVRVIELPGRFILPGFIDTHAHVTILRWSRNGNGAPAGRYDRGVSERVLRVLLEHGVTTVRNPGAPAAEGVRLRDDVARGVIHGPRILTAGDGLLASASPAEIRATVRAQAALGVDYVKLSPGMSPEQTRAAIQEAHAHGIRAMGHLQRTTWTAAARMGIDAITHGSPWSPEYLPAEKRAAYVQTLRGRLDWLEWVDVDGPEIDGMIEALVRARIPVDPTLIAYHTDFWADDSSYTASRYNALAPEIAADWQVVSFTDDFTPADFARGKRLWPKVLRLVRRYHEAGVLLTAGSDLPNPWVVPGISLHQELALLRDAGIPNLDVLRIATINGARSLGIDDETGSIDAGRVADLVVLRRDPRQRIEHTRDIEYVFRAGTPYGGDGRTP